MSCWSVTLVGSTVLVVEINYHFKEKLDYY